MAKVAGVCVVEMIVEAQVPYLRKVPTVSAEQLPKPRIVDVEAVQAAKVMAVVFEDEPAEAVPKLAAGVLARA